MIFRSVVAGLSIATLLGGCCDPYVEPVGPPEKMATVQGSIAAIDHDCVKTGKKVTVTPGHHDFWFVFGGGVSFGPVSAAKAAHDASPSGVAMRLDLQEGHQYHFAVHDYLGGARLVLHNLTTNRKTYFDPERIIYYDDANNLIPRPTGAFAP